MVTSDVYIRKYDWNVRIYFAVTCYYTDEILDALYGIDCPPDVMNRAYNNMMQCALDTGLTYSNSHRSIMVVALSSSPAQFLNSFEHELRHLTDHIAIAEGLESGSEDVAYLTGDLNSMLWEYSMEFRSPVR